MNNSINRRSFLGRSLVGLGALVAAPTLLSQIPQAASAAVSSGNLLFCGAGLSIGDILYVGDKGCITPIRDPIYGHGRELGVVTGPSTIKLCLMSN